MSNFSIQSNVATSSGSIYAAGDVVGTLMQFPYAEFSAGIDKALHSARLTDLGKQSAAITFLLFNSHPDQTFWTDNSPLDLHDTDAKKLIGRVKFAASDYTALADNSVATKEAQGTILPGNLTGALWVGTITEGTPTYTSTSDLNVEFFFI